MRTALLRGGIVGAVSMVTAMWRDVTNPSPGGDSTTAILGAAAIAGAFTLLGTAVYVLGPYFVKRWTKGKSNEDSVTQILLDELVDKHKEIEALRKQRDHLDRTIEDLRKQVDDRGRNQ